MMLTLAIAGVLLAALPAVMFFANLPLFVLRADDSEGKESTP